VLACLWLFGMAPAGEQHLQTLQQRRPFLQDVATQISRLFAVQLDKSTVKGFVS
jgi:hypothetical protein